MSDLSSSGLFQYFNLIKKYPKLSQDQFNELLAKARKGDHKAYEVLITSNLRLVIFLARRFLGRGVELEDLIQEGTIGLIRALDDFDSSFGFRFSNYGSYWINAYLHNCVTRDRSLLKLPNNVDRDLFKVSQAERQIKSQQGIHPSKVSLTELSEKTNFDPEKISLLLNYRETQQHDLATLDNLDDFQTDQNSGNLNKQEKSLLLDEIVKLINSWFSDLDYKDRYLLYYRYGISKPLQLHELKLRFGCSHEHVRTHINELLADLRLLFFHKGIGNL